MKPKLSRPKTRAMKDASLVVFLRDCSRMAQLPTSQAAFEEAASRFERAVSLLVLAHQCLPAGVPVLAQIADFLEVGPSGGMTAKTRAQRLLDVCTGPAASYLSEWDKKFLRSMLESPILTTRQDDVLRRIERKVFG